MFGQKFFDQLKEYDSRIQPLAANRRRQELPDNSKRLRFDVAGPARVP
jgi:hypothetical protein